MKARKSVLVIAALVMVAVVSVVSDKSARSRTHSHVNPQQLADGGAPTPPWPKLILVADGGAPTPPWPKLATSQEA